MDNEQRCGTCKWWRDWRISPSSYRQGDCTWDGDMPIWGNIAEKVMQQIDGKDCPTWHAK